MCDSLLPGGGGGGRGVLASGCGAVGGGGGLAWVFGSWSRKFWQVGVPDARGRRSLSAAALLGGLGEQQRQEFLAGIKAVQLGLVKDNLERQPE